MLTVIDIAQHRKGESMWFEIQYHLTQPNRSKYLHKCIKLTLCLIILLALTVNCTQAQSPSGYVSATAERVFESQGEYDISLTDVFRLMPFPDWGIKASINAPGGFVKIRLTATDAGVNHQTVLEIVHNTESFDGYKHDASFSIQRASEGMVLENFSDAILDNDRLNKEISPGPGAGSDLVWNSNNYTRALVRAWSRQHQATPLGVTIKKDSLLKVKMEVTIVNATFKELYIPGMDQIAPQRLIGKGVVVIVINSSGVRKDHVFSVGDQTLANTVTSNSTIFGMSKNGTDLVVRTKAGDKVTYEVFGSDTSVDPIIKGVPKIYASCMAAQREFITIPDYGPNQYLPWIAFEAQTHFRMINSYPENFKNHTKTGDWIEKNNGKSWVWYAQRTTDPAQTKYEPNVYYPKTRETRNQSGQVNGYQRESQSVGWLKQFLNIYDERQNGNIKQYITGFDIDDFLFVGNKKDNANPYSDWLASATNPSTAGIVTAINYEDTQGPIPLKNQNWQQMWPSEEEGNLNIATGDVLGNSPNTIAVSNKNYPLVWDAERGLPKAGFILNDMITAYQKFKAANDGNPETDLASDYYFNGYEIEDLGTHFVSQTSQSTGDNYLRRTDNKPVPCDFDCWFNANYSIGNTKHPGVISITIDPGSSGSQTISFRQEVLSPLADPVKNPADGFYGSISGDQWPMGWGRPTTYSLKGVQSTDVDRVQLCLLEYNVGVGMYKTTKVFKNGEGASYDPVEKTLTADIEIYNGWTAIAAYYKSVDGKDSVIIAGRAPMIMDPLTSLTIPGSNPNPYDNVSLAQAPPPATLGYGLDIISNFFAPLFSTTSSITDFTNLAEGQGDRSYETMNEFRKYKDSFRGYDFPNGTGFSKRFVREYVLDINERVTFAAMDAGRKIKSYWPNGNDDPYQSWRELSRRMPSDVVAQRIKWNILKKNAQTGEYDQFFGPQTSRHFEYQFTTPGEYIIQESFNGLETQKTEVHVVVKDFTDAVRSTDPATLSQNLSRGEIETRPLTFDEKRWLTSIAGASISASQLDEYRVAEVKDINSFYAYSTGPRASIKPHREGEANDFNEKFSWDSESPSQVVSPYTQPAFVNHYLGAYDPQNSWPAAWKNVWVHHIPSAEIPRITEAGTVIYDDESNTTRAEQFNVIVDRAFNELTAEQATLDWIRWFPWIGISPSKGYKFNRYVKTVVDIDKFFDNGGLGVFSGEADNKVGEVSNAVESNAWFDYGSPKAQLPSDKEFERHLSDDTKNQLEFYYDLKYNRKVIYTTQNAGLKKLIAYNNNPKLFPGDATKPDRIHIAGKELFEDPEYANANESIAGIPLLTFDGARKGQTDLNSNYTLSGSSQVVYTLESKGFNRYLKAVVPPGAQREILRIESPEALGNTSGLNIYGFGFEYTTEALNLNSTSNIYMQVFNQSNTEIFAFQTPNLANGNFQITKYLASQTSASNFKSIVISITNNDNSPIVLKLDNFRLLDQAQSITPTAFAPDANDAQMLDWLRNSSYRFFDWNFIPQVSKNTGAFLEEHGSGPRAESRDFEKVSLSGQGMGIAVTILAAESGFISAPLAEQRVERVIRWLTDLDDDSNSNGVGDLFDGSKGWHGMPSHYYHANGELFDFNRNDSSSAELAISTIDWAICAQGVRLAKRYYPNNAFIQSAAPLLLTQVDWNKFVMPVKNGVIDPQDPSDLRFKNGGRIAFDLNQKTGEINPSGNAWGQAFSEETDLVYLEALAASADAGLTTNLIDIDRVIYTDENGKDIKVINRKWKDGMFPSYFGAGFTYNWLQLWMGSKELAYNLSNQYVGISTANTRYYDNSASAYAADNAAAIAQFIDPFMGLTAASTVSAIRHDGFVEYGEYLSNQGSYKNLANAGEVIQVAPAPYGAALSLPFTQSLGIAALRAYVGLGFYHEYMGLPDNVVFEGIGDSKPLPNWNQLDINTAPIAMAIDQIRGKVISTSLMTDQSLRNAYKVLYESFNEDYNASFAQQGSGRIADNTEQTQQRKLERGVYVYPNPTHGDFTIAMAADKPGIYRGLFMDAMGKPVTFMYWEIDTAGEHHFAVQGLTAKGLADGPYFVVIIGPGGKRVIPVIVKH